MKKCPNCGVQVDDNSLFCTECGKQIPQGNVCPHCGASMNSGDSFCQNCGSKVEGDDGLKNSSATAPEQKRCPHCGAIVSNDSLFCENCGRNMSDGNSTPNINFHPQTPYATESRSQNKFILPIIIGLSVLAIAGGGWWYYKSYNPRMNGYAITPNDNDSIAKMQEPLEEYIDSVESEELVGDVVDSVVFSDSLSADFVDAESAATRTIKSEDNTERTREREEVQAQRSTPSNKVYDVVEQMPSFPGGDAALMQFLATQIKYPAVAEENGIQGRVIVTFVVERDGSISSVVVAKGVDPSLDKEAVRVTKSMPKWRAGTQNGEPVRVKYTMPITFRLQ